jgi:hypothetical protein
MPLIPKTSTGQKRVPTILKNIFDFHASIRFLVLHVYTLQDVSLLQFCVYCITFVSHSSLNLSP